MGLIIENKGDRTSILSTYKGQYSEGYNTFIGGGGQSSVGINGSIAYGSYNVSVGYDSLFSNTTGYANTALGYRTLHDTTTGTLNIATGYQASYFNTTGFNNVVTGVQALFLNTVGHSNSVYGTNTMTNNIIGVGNTAIGMIALQENVSGSYNTAVGYSALGANVAGDYNTAIGYNSSYYQVTGSNNISIGYYAGSTLNSGNLYSATSSIFIGSNTKALANGSTNEIVIGDSAVGNGSNTVTIGNSSVLSNDFSGLLRFKQLNAAGAYGSELNTSPSSWTIGANIINSGSGIYHFLGNSGYIETTIPVVSGKYYRVYWNYFEPLPDYDGYITVTLSADTSVPMLSFQRTECILYASSTGNTTLRLTPTTDYNYKIFNITCKAIETQWAPTIIGTYGGSTTTEMRLGSNNIGIGKSALANEISGVLNIAIGNNAMKKSVAGGANIAIGDTALSSHIGGWANLAVGEQALAHLEVGGVNLAIGNLALHEFTSNNSLAIGHNAAQNTVASEICAIGYLSLTANTTGGGNLGVGILTGNANTAGANNTIVGQRSFVSNTIGSNNTVLGYGACASSTSGSNSVYIGSGANTLLNGSMNEIVIGYNAVGSGSNTVTLGNASIVKTVLRGQVVIGTSSTTPSSGSMKYESGHMYFWNGAVWKQFAEV